MTKASGSDRIPAKLFKILKDAAVTVLHAMLANLENSAVATGLEKVSFPPKPNGEMPKNVQTIIQLLSFDQLVRLCSKSFTLGSAVCEPRTSRCISWVSNRQKKQRSNCLHWMDHRKSKRIPENTDFCFIDYSKAFDCADHTNYGKFLKRQEYQTITPIS